MSAEGRQSRPLIHLVPHTHWDREWYLPFQSFRLRLVELIDLLLARMLVDPDLAFTLDGQVATVDDYLEVRPEAEPSIRRLIDEGRLAIGPWQILMDEFLTSGETIVRNLELGWRRAEALGGVMPIGYLPDMFGHVAQMPQILRRAGIERAVVWRGVPMAIDRNTFTWRSPDGSEVVTEYLVGGYGNAMHVFDVPSLATRKLLEYRTTTSPFYGGDSVLAMYGTDHWVPTARLTELVADANRSQDQAEIRIETLTEYVVGNGVGARGALPDLQWTGELRSGARANMLMNVTSNHMDVKAAASRAERLLTRYAEPMAALYTDAWPARLLELAWRRVIENSAHDSICACSDDAVVAQVLTRFAEAEQIGQGILSAALGRIATGVDHPGWVVANPVPAVRKDVVELDVVVPPPWAGVGLEIDGQPVPSQEVDRLGRTLFRETMAASELADFLLRRTHDRELFGQLINRMDLERTDGDWRLAVEVDAQPDPPELDVDGLIDGICQRTAALGGERIEVTVATPDRRRLLVQVSAPALGWCRVQPVSASPDAVASPDHPVALGEATLSNGLVEVHVRPDGTLDMQGGGTSLEGVGRLVDGGDFGDSYNYGPPANDELVERPISVAVTISGGPLQGELVIVRTYEWPLDVQESGDGRSRERVLTEVATRVQLRAGEQFARVQVEFENRSRDHRLRFHIPLSHPVDQSAAEGQFAVVERGLTAEGGHGEVPLATFPACAFVDAGTVAVLLQHVSEYELIEGKELALTVLRATGLISRNANPYREEPAGPEIAIPSAQQPGPWSFAFALYPHSGAWTENGVLEAAEQYRYPMSALRGTRRGGIPFEEANKTDGGLSVDGRGIVLSSLRRRDGWLELRLVAEHPAPDVAVVRGRFAEARQADLLGRPGDILPCDPGVLRMSLAPWEIRTVQLR